MTTEQTHHVTVHGQGAHTLVFAHGYGCNQTVWQPLVDRFAKSYHVVTFDHIGFGKSDPKAYDEKRHSSLEGYASDLLQILAEHDLNDVIYVGHSVSTMVGVLAARREPQRFARLVLVTPSPYYGKDGSYDGGFTRAALSEALDTLQADYKAWARAMAPTIMGRGQPQRLADLLAETFCQADVEIAKKFAPVLFFADVRAALRDVRQPTLILQCSEDVFAPESVGEFVHQQIAGSRYVKLPVTGHFPHICAPRQVEMHIREFLRSP